MTSTPAPSPGKTDISPVPLDPDEKLNWDVVIETPPPRPGGEVRVRLIYRGRSKPLPLTDPRCDED